MASFNSELNKLKKKTKELFANEHSVLATLNNVNNIILSKPLTENIDQYYKDILKLFKSSNYQIDLYRPLSRRRLVQLSLPFIRQIVTSIFDEPDKYKEIENLLKRFTCFHCDGVSLRTSDFTYNKLFDDVKEIIYHFLTISFPSIDLVNQFLHNWHNLEKLIFDIEAEYREHFLHQFYVFLLGCILLNSLMLRIEYTWLHSEPFARSRKEMKRRTFRSWLAASLFHDFGNFLSKLDKMNDLINNVYFNYSHFINLTEYNADVILDNPKIREYINRMESVAEFGDYQYVEYFEKIGINYSSDFPIIIAGFKKKDHGILSSLLFWNAIRLDIKLGMREIAFLKETDENVTENTLKKWEGFYSTDLRMKQTKIQMEGDDNPDVIIFRKATYALAESLKHSSRRNIYDNHLPPVENHLASIQQDIDRHNELQLEIREDMDISSFAIGMHNLRPFKINFEKHSIAFVLLLCDEIQQFGRFHLIEGEKNVPNIEISDLHFYYLYNEDRLKEILDFKHINNFPFQIISDKNILRGLVLCSLEGGDDAFWTIMKERLSQLFTYNLCNGPHFIMTKSGPKDNKLILVAWARNDGNYQLHINN